MPFDGELAHQLEQARKRTVRRRIAATLLVFACLLFACDSTAAQGTAPTSTAAAAPGATQPTATINPTQAVPSAVAVPVGGTDTAVPSSATLAILSSSEFVDNIGDKHVVGEVQNNSSSPMFHVKIVVTSYDANNQVLATNFGSTIADVIAPHKKAPFDVVFTNKLSDEATYKLAVQGEQGQLGRQDLVITSQSSNVDKDGRLHIPGEVQNSGNTPATYVEIIATFYNSAGTVVDTAYTYTSLATVPAGQSSPFELIVQLPTSIDHYELQVQGL